MLFILFVASYLTLHLLFSFQTWDRYLLGIVPLLALLAARGLLFGWQKLVGRPQVREIVAALALAALAWGAGQAALARIPIGGDHGAYAGIEEVAAYLQKTVPARKGVLYQRWLGWHWNWYLWDGPHGRVYWSDPAMLVEDLRDDPTGYERFVVFPGWHLDEREPLAAALTEYDLTLAERLTVRSPDTQRVQFVVYQIVPAKIGSISKLNQSTQDLREVGE